MAIYGNVVLPISIQGQIQASHVTAGVTLVPSIQGQISSVALTGSIAITISNQITAEWPDTGTQSGWEINAVQYVSAPGFEITLPAPSFQMSGQDSAIGILTVPIPAPKVTFSGIVSAIGTLSAVPAAFKFYAKGSVGVTGTLVIGVPALTFLNTGERGATGTLTIEFPIQEVAFSGHVSAEGTLSVTLPTSNMLFAVSPISYLNMVMNIRNQALTTFTNYDFNSMCRFNGVHLGATATGIFDLDTGDNDDGTLIEWNFKLGYIDLEQKIKKKIHQAWISCKSDGDLIATIITPAGDSWEYPVSMVNNTENGIRVIFGKGIKSKYVALDIKNVDGSTIDLDAIRLNFDQYSKQR